MIRALGVLAVLFVFGTPPRVRAETLVFRNDCSVSIIVQLASVHRGVFSRDRPYLLRPGDATTPGIELPGDKVITVYDAKVPNRVLFQGALPGSTFDRHFRILPDATPRVRVQLQAPRQP
jgi:hypothetical protein